MSANSENSLPSLLSICTEKYADETAIEFGGRATDFKTFHSMSDRVAASMSEQGIRKGDRIGLYCINSDAFAMAYFGIVKAGATVVPINLLLNPREIAYILNDSEARGLIYFEAFQEAVSLVRPNVPSIEFVVRIGQTPPADGELDWKDLLQTAGSCPEIEFSPDEDTAAILYTSGTTGKPKGAMLTHRNLASNVNSIRNALHLEPGRDVLLVVLPMFHAFAATVGMLFPLLNGCRMIPLPKFDPAQVADAIEKHNVTFFMAVPSMYNVLLRMPTETVDKFKSLTLCVSGGAAMPIEVMKQFEQRFGLPVYEGDGPTECSPVTCVNPIGGTIKPGSVGKTVPDVEMIICNDHGKELPCGEIGEICVRGPNVMKGYWKRPEDTKAAFFDEWFRTGDMGYRDEDDYFYIVDRKKDMLIVNGMNVYPRVIEEILYQYDSVQEAAVVGEPNDLHGEIPVAYIALKEGSNAGSKDIRDFCREHLGRHEIPRKLYFVKELPKNAAGKILKRELRKSGEYERGIRNDGKPG